jgi:hypothetical protein
MYTPADEEFACVDDTSVLALAPLPHAHQAAAPLTYSLKYRVPVTGPTANACGCRCTSANADTVRLAGHTHSCTSQMLQIKLSQPVTIHTKLHSVGYERR